MRNIMHVIADAPDLSAINPANIAPNAPPISNDMERYADSDEDTLTIVLKYRISTKKIDINSVIN